jgi:predicted N-acetyltransferase YhbS
MIEKVGTPPLQNITEIKDVLMIVEKGDCLTPYQLERVEKILVVIKRLKDYLSRGKMYENSLAYYDENLNEISELREEILSKIRGSIVDDHATKELEIIRRQVIECEEQMKQVEEIRSKKYYVPELEFIMVNENDEPIGYVMFSRFHIEGKYEDELLLLSPVAVKTELQRQHISKELIEYGFEKAKEMGYKVALVEGNPRNYNSRGFVTSADYGIVAAPSVGLPAPECMMVKELVEGALKDIKGRVEYTFYECLR